MNEPEADPYERLFKTLDKIPHGFSKAKDGVTHLKILKWIFSEEEADLASKMKLMGETVEELSARLEISSIGLEDKLERMVSKGQIIAINTRTGRRYALIPFPGGIYDEQVNRMDAEFAQLIEDYFPQFQGSHIGNTEPAFFRIIPINKVIKPELTVYPFEQAKHLVETAKSWGIRDCMCKKQLDLLGNSCKYPKTVCLNLSQKEGIFEDHHVTEPITKEEALDYLRMAEEAGLIHNSMNIGTGHYMLCNCCTCCCTLLRSVSKWDYPLAYMKSNYHIEVDSDLCKGHGTCVDRCQFGALEVVDEVSKVNLEKCVGCGVCAITCPEEALSLVLRSPDEQSTPPENLRKWMMQKAISRQVDPSDLL